MLAIRRSGRERRVANAKPRMIAASSVALPANRNVRATPLCARVTAAADSPTPTTAIRRFSPSTATKYSRSGSPLTVTVEKPARARRSARASGVSRSRAPTVRPTVVPVTLPPSSAFQTRRPSGIRTT